MRHVKAAREHPTSVIWYLETEDPPTGSNPRVEWFDRRNVSKLADSFAEFMDSLRPLDDAAGASASR